MSRNCRNRCIYLLAIALTPGCLAFAQDRSKLQGWKPYTPSRLEWLAVELNAGLRTDATEANPYSLSLVPLENEDTILIYVLYHPTVNREVMNIAVDTARKAISTTAKTHGWTWLKVRERIELADLNPK
jgi:hypothetical protein